jgi:glycosyltransferase involved in cell wall biosynthesis
MWDKTNNRNTKKITTVFHAFNNEAVIGSKILKARQYADRVIVVDNCSTDHTAEIAQLAGAHVAHHLMNLGKEASFRTGLELARLNGSNFIVTMDSDEEPDIIPKILEPIWNEGYDIVMSSRCRSNIPYSMHNVLSMQRKMSHDKQCLALSMEALKRIDLRKQKGSIVKDFIDQAEKNGLKTKFLEYENSSNSNQFRDHDIGIVVPAYNEEMLIEETIKGIPKYVKKIYVIDDCSTDRTQDIIKSMADPRIVNVRHEKNKGVGAAIITGYKLALEDKMEIAAVMAGDNQMDPEELPKLLIPIIEGRTEYTKGNRLINKEFRTGMSKWRFLGNAMLTMITKIGSGYWHITDPQNGYTAISGQALEKIDIDSIYPYYGYCNDILIKLNTFGIRVEDVSIPARYGSEKSKIKYSSYIVKVASMNFRGFLWRLKTKYVVLDFHPLVFFYLASMVLVPSGVLFGMWILIQKWYKIPVSQNFPLLAALMMLMGVQFLLFAMLFDMQADKSRSGNV